MKQFLAVVAAFVLAAALATPTTPNTAPMLREQNGFSVVARIENNALNLRVLENFQPYGGVVHTYLVARDQERLYFQYPENPSPGQYTLDLPSMESGVYDLVLEITGGNGHEHDNPKFVQVYPLGATIVADQNDSKTLERVRRISLKASNTEAKSAGTRSNFELTVQLDGKPVAWPPYYVHQLILKTDWSYFKHDHPQGTRNLGVGMVQSFFGFPSAGEYVVYQYLETGLSVDGQKVRPVLRLPGTIRVPQ